MIKPRLCKLTFALLTGVGIVVACSVDDANTAVPECNGLNCTPLTPGGRIDAQDVPSGAAVPPDAAAAPEVAPAKDICGVGSCLPEDTSACSDYTPPISDAGAEPDASAPNPAPADAGADAGSEGPAIDGSFAQPSRPSSGPPRFACQLWLDDGAVVRACGATGSQQAEQACTTSLDCAPGLGCVGPVRSGRCLPYCCGMDDADTCEAGFYCAQRPLRNDALGEADGPPVPVCVRADNCSLGEPENCVGPRCLCGPDMACKTVRPDGTTSCMPLPDEPAQAGDVCVETACDRGYHCSPATTPPMCVKTCDLDEADSDQCGQGVCQAAAALPAGWGICVAATPEQMR